MVRSILISGLLIGSLSAHSIAQEQSNKPAPSNLAIEIVQPQSHHLMPVATDGRWEIGLPARLADAKPAQDATPLTRITIGSAIEGDGVRIKIGGIFDDSYPADAPGPKYGAKEKPLASYFAHEGDTVAVKELEDYGFEKLILRVTKDRNQAVQEAGTSLLPQLVNNLESIDLVHIQVEGTPPAGFLLSVQNRSSKDIIGLSLKIDEAETHSMFPLGAKPLIAAQAMIQTHFSLEGDAAISPKSVLFADGSYEGDVVSAAEMAGQRKGNQIQMSRLLQLLIDQPVTRNADETIGLLKEKINGLRIDVDPAVIDELQSQFPALPKQNGRAWVAEKIMEGLKRGRGHGLFRIEEIEKERHRQADFDWPGALTKLTDKIRSYVGSN
jgi:hypothetical protein